MSRLLVCAATALELNAWEAIPKDFPSGKEFTGQGGVTLALTGIGIPLAVLNMVAVLEKVRPALILNIGIAGAYVGGTAALGDIVIAESEVFGDIGFEEAQGFTPIGRSPFCPPDQAKPFALQFDSQLLPTKLAQPKLGKGCTVNTCAGTPETGAKRRKLFQVDFETMEGAAICLVGQKFGIPVCEIRAISNYASSRDMRRENIRIALQKLQAYLQDTPCFRNIDEN